MNDYTMRELIQKKAEAESKSSTDAAVYTTAIGFKKELDAALKGEEYEKAAELKEKLVALKLNGVANPKVKELQDAIAKAVAEEDFEKARILKEELTAITNGQVKKSTTITKSETKTTTSPTVATAITSPVTYFTKNDIYTAGVTFMGLDYSLFTVVSTKNINKEELISKNIPFWQRTFVNATNDYMSKWLGRKTINYDKMEVEGLYKKNLSRSWVVPNFTPLTTQQLQNHIQTYPSKNNGLGLVFIQGSYDEVNDNTVMYVVWYDTNSKVIVHSQEVVRHSRPSGFEGRWKTGVFDAFEMYSKIYKDRR